MSRTDPGVTTLSASGGGRPFRWEEAGPSLGRSMVTDRERNGQESRATEEPGTSAAVATVREAQLLLVSLLALGSVAALYFFRAMDDNRLTRWDWVFAHTDPIRLFSVVGAGIMMAYLLVKIPFRRRRPASLLFLCSYGIAACFWGQPEVIVDASRYFSQAKHLEIYGLGFFLREWGRDIQAWTDLPLVPVLYGLTFKLLGESRIWIQALNTLLFSATVVLTYRIGRTLWNADLGFWAGLLLLGNPYIFTQVPGMLADVPSMFFYTLAVFAFLQALHHGGWARVMLASLTLVLAMLSKYSIWVLLSVLPLLCLVDRARSAQSRIRTASGIALIAGSILVAALLLKYDVFNEQVGILLGYQMPGLYRWQESFLSTFLFQIHPFVTLAAAFSILVAIRGGDPKLLGVVWPLLVMLLLRVERIRYLIPILPMVALMASYGLQAVREKEVRALVGGCAVASSVVLAFYGYHPFLSRNSAVNLKEAGEYVNMIPGKHAEVFSIAGTLSEVNPAVAVPILDLFTKKPLIYRNGAVPSLEPQAWEHSPLRFTWGYKNPAYYSALGAEGDGAVVVITDDLDRSLPEPLESRLAGYRVSRIFGTSENVFRYRTFVQVFQSTREGRGETQGPVPWLPAPSNRRRGI